MRSQPEPRPGKPGAAAGAWRPWIVWLLIVCIAIAAAVLGYLNNASVSLGNVFFESVMLAFATVGALIASRRAGNRIGWLLLGGTCLISFGGMALDYAVYTLLTAPRALPAGEWMLWVGAWARSLGFFTLVIFVPLVFPNGKLPSPRWRRVARFALGGAAVFTLVVMFSPTNQTELRLPPLANPLGIALAPNIYGPLNGISFLWIGAATILAAASVVIRFRRAVGEERQQLKWFAYAGVLAAIVFLIILIGVFLLSDAVMAAIGGTLFSLLLAGFPIAIGVAILKYRLYEIDLLINRTLVYLPLTAMLAGIFAASITLTQKLFVALTGEKSDAATVLTTLIVVAAFEPLKTGLQHLVDKRFKQPHKKFGSLAEQVRSVLQVIDEKEITGRLLDDAMKEFDADGGAVYLGGNGDLRVARTAGRWKGIAELAVPMIADGQEIGRIALGPRRHGVNYVDADRASLEEIGSLVARAIALSERKATAEE